MSENIIARRNEFHAANRSLEMFGFVVNFARIKETIRVGLAKQIPCVVSDRRIFDVPYVDASTGNRYVVRVVVDETIKTVITVLPPEFRSDGRKSGKRQRHLEVVSAKKRSTQRHFKEMKRHFRDEAETTLVTPYRGDEEAPTQ